VLVCLASALLMLVTVYEDHWVRTPGESRLDPTRMAQGIMTGIGFLGAGVIVKEGLNVRGLTTAASIWITAGIGVLAGVGLYLPLVVSVLLTLAVLSYSAGSRCAYPRRLTTTSTCSTRARATSPRRPCASCSRSWASA